MASSEGQGGGVDSSTGAYIGSTQRPTAKYNAITNSLRVLTTGSMQCSMFCGGKGCKYDNPAKWTEDQMAIKGLFSHWVTKKILAMSRPSTDAVKKYDIINQFKQQGIKAVINLQTPGEHAHCGLGLEPGGFSYDQQEFMDNDIFFYNFGWDDYGVKSLTFILDMVKVMSFAVKEGKVGVHCHAGLGRTGVLIACYLIYAKRFDGDHAIHFVREKRPGSIQTKGQVECCQQFAQFLIPLRVVFASCDPCSYPFTLQQFINRQRHLLHGEESRELKNIPKIVKVVCVRLHQLANIRDVHSPMSLERQDSSDLRSSVPGAFQDTRHSRTGPHNNGPNNRPALGRRSSSLEQLEDAKGLGSEKRWDAPAMSKSPSLDMRKMHGTRSEAIVSSSEDDSLSIGRGNRGPGGLQVGGSQSEGALSGRGRLPSRSSLLSQLSLSSLDEGLEVGVVGEAMAFQLGTGKSQDDDVDEEEDEDEAKPTAETMATEAASMNLRHRVESLQHNLNQSQAAWRITATEDDPFVLAALMWSWLEQLKEPVLQVNEISELCEYEGDILKAVTRLDKNERLTVECILKTIAGLRPLPEHIDQGLIHRFVNAVTQRQAGDSCSRELCRFVERYVRAFRAKLPQLEPRPARPNAASSKPSKQKDALPASPREERVVVEKKKGKKKKEKSPTARANKERTSPRENGNDSSEDEQMKRIIVPKTRGKALPPIF